MDSDDEELLAELLEEEAQTDVDDAEHLLVLRSLAALLAEQAKPRRGGSRPGRRKSKPRQRYEGYCILYSDYFADNPTQDEAVMKCCVILHNMIIESERNDPVHDGEYYRQGSLAQVDHDVPASWANYLTMRQEIRDSNVHLQLQRDLVEHLWRRKGNGIADA